MVNHMDYGNVPAKIVLNMEWVARDLRITEYHYFRMTVTDITDLLRLTQYR